MTVTVEIRRHRIVNSSWPASSTRHEILGFHEGWGKATDQLAELVATL